MAIRLPSDLSTRMFDLEKLYKEYGDPDRILVVPEDCSQGKGCWANMLYMYHEERFMSQSAAYIEEIKSRAVSLCIFVLDSGDITTWAPGIRIDFKASIKDTSRLLALDQGTQGRISEFFVKNNNQEMCFEVPREDWK